jgi:hypothetical protein
MRFDTEFFGPPELQGAFKKSALLWDVVCDDPRFNCHGRAVGVSYDGGDEFELLTTIARLTGASACEGVPVSAAGDYVRKLQSNGFQTDRYEMWRSGPDLVEMAEQVVAAHCLPEDLDLVKIDEMTPSQLLHTLSELTENSGIPLPMGSFVRGVTRPGIFMMALDKQGEPVGHAGASAAYSQHSPRANTAFWGLLTTAPHRRGERIALILGAMVIIEMHRLQKIKTFVTGIKQGNITSEKLCAKLSLAATDTVTIIAIDPTIFSGQD